MHIILAKENTVEKQEMRTAYCQTLVELAKDNADILALDADLMAAMGTKPFQAAYPAQTIDCGIQEANMIGVAAGLSAVGKIPFAHTFASFASRRACDQVFVSAAYAKLNIKIVGSDPGITATLNGGTHMPFEDMGIMRGIPTVTVLEPTDTVMLAEIMRQIVQEYGVHYLRLVRKNVKKVYEAGSKFEIGKMVPLADGNDVTIIASGFCVSESIQAAKVLRELGIHARVLDSFCWKPIDKETILVAARETGAIVTAENHNIINGLGSAVAEVVTRNLPVPMEMVGVQDEFGEVGPLDYLAERYKLTGKYIVEAVKKAIARKV